MQAMTPAASTERAALIDEATGVYHGILVALLAQWKHQSVRTRLEDTETAEDEAPSAGPHMDGAHGDAGHGRTGPRNRKRGAAAAAAAPVSAAVRHIEAALSRCLLKLGDLGTTPPTALHPPWPGGC